MKNHTCTTPLDHPGMHLSVVTHATPTDAPADVALNPSSDPYARVAMQAYVDACAAELPWLAEALQRQYGLASGTPSPAAMLWRTFHAAQQQARMAEGYDAGAWAHVAMHLSTSFGAMNL